MIPKWQEKYQWRKLQSENNNWEIHKVWKEYISCFIDNEKAFDRVKHAKIIECMENRDIDGKYISLIRNLYWNQNTYTITEDGLSPEIHNKRGVRQGCALSPCMFNLYTQKLSLEQLLPTKAYLLVEQHSLICATICTKYWMQWTALGKAFDMKMNAKKTKTMLVSKDVTSTTVSLKIVGDIIKQTDNYTY